MRKLIGTFLVEWPYSAPVLAFVLLLIPVVFFSATGTYFPEQLPWYFESTRALQGVVLMFTLLLPYMGACLVVSLRRSIALAQQVDAVSNTQLVSKLLSFPYRMIALFVFTGILFAIFFNMPGYGLNFLETHLVDQSLIISQLIIWAMITGLLSIRFYIAYCFQSVSNDVAIDILEPSNLKPFAQVGLIDALIIAGALIISTVQSLDLSFRPNNYLNAMIIAVPSMLYLAIYPMWLIHKRMRAEKVSQLIEVNALISHARRNLVEADMNTLETLLQRRQRIQEAPTWPIDISIVQRFVFYIIIPPLAWVGAAVVELIIDGFIQGQ